MKEGFKENRIETEKEPQKRILLIRHPSQELFWKLVDEASERGEDVETYLPVSKEGLAMVKNLSEYLKTELPNQVKDKEYGIYSSPIKRADSEANILLKNIKLSKTEKTDLPMPADNEVQHLDSFKEIPFSSDKEYVKDLIKRAKERNIPLIELWREDKGEEILLEIQKKVDELKKGFEHLKNRKTSLDIVISHRLTIATAIWLASNPEKMEDEEYELTMDDLDEIFNYGAQLPFTSITEIDVVEDDLKLKELGTTPHLEGDEDKEKLIKGTF